MTNTTSTETTNLHGNQEDRLRGGAVVIDRCRSRVHWEDRMSSESKDSLAAAPTSAPRLPPRWFVRTAWVVHRAFYRLTGGRRGLWRPKVNRWGTMRLTTIGRRTGRERSAILGYYEDGPNLVTMAMNGWADGEPAWWLNLQAHRDASVAWPMGRARCAGVRPREKNEHAYGRGGAT